MNISKLELRLLSFFNQFCMPLFSFGVNHEVHQVWHKQVPMLFLESPLIRSSIYSFAALNLFPLCDLSEFKHETISMEELESRALVLDFGLYNMDSKLGQNSLYITTTKYFLDTVSKANLSIPEEGNAQKKGFGLSQMKAAEMSISSILIFSFLGIHPHKLMPLVIFDRSDTDYLSLTGCMHATFTEIAPTLINSPFRGLYSLKEESNTPPTSLKESKIPWIMRLRDELLEYYILDIDFDKTASMVDLDEPFELSDLFSKNSTPYSPKNPFVPVDPPISPYEGPDASLYKRSPSPIFCLESSSAHEYETLHHSIELFQTLTSRAVHFNYPVPMFRWILLLNQDFRDLIYKENFFSLRILYVYSCIAFLSGFQLYNDTNMWIDFIHTFHEYNLNKFGGWKYSIDEAFFIITAEKKHRFKDLNYRQMGDLDPEKLVELFKTQGI